MPGVVGDCQTWPALLPTSVSPCSAWTTMLPHLLGKRFIMGKICLLMAEVSVAQLRAKKVRGEGSL